MLDSGAMVDLVHLRLFFKTEFVVGWEDFSSVSEALVSGRGCLVDVGSLSVPTYGETFINSVGEKSICNESHPFESLPSSYSGIAFKIYRGDDVVGVARVELKFSPAKTLQGHNLFGPADLSLCAQVGLLSLSLKYPHLFDMLDVSEAEVVQLDVTYSAKAPSRAAYTTVFDYLRNLSRGHAKTERNDMTVYFYSRKSRNVRIKIYGKAEEFNNELGKIFRASKKCPIAARRLSVMTDARLVGWAENLVRCEVTLGPRFFDVRGISRRLVDLIKLQREFYSLARCCLGEWWQAAMKNILSLFEVGSIRVVDDDALFEKIRSLHFKDLPSGNISYAYADSLIETYMLIRDRGWREAVKLRKTKQRTFRRHVADLVVAGLSRAQLMNYTAEAVQLEYAPIVSFVDFVFSASGQRPDWYVTPEIDIDFMVQAAQAA